MRYLTLLSILLISVAGCTESEPESSATDVNLTPVNQLCPIMGNPVTEDGGTAEYNGKLVGFCCAGCDGPWSELSDADKAEKLASADTVTEAHGEHGHGHGHDDGDHEHADGDKDADGEHADGDDDAADKHADGDKDAVVKDAASDE